MQEEFEMVEEITPEPPHDILTGVVSGCKQLYVREEPNKSATPLKIIKENDEVMIEVEESTEEFYKVYTESGIEGFCMKEFIAVRP